MLSFAFSAILVLVSAPGPAGAATEDAAEAVAGPVDARVVSAHGEVFVIQRDQPDEGVPADPDNATPLEAGDRVRTGADSSAEIGLEGNSVLELGPNSEFTVASLEREEPSFTLGIGALMAKVKKMFTKEGRLVVRTPNAVAAVRGTEFGVEVAEDEGETHVAVFDEGKVAVSSEQGEGETMLEANHETAVKRGERPLRAARLKFFAKHRERMGLVRKRLTAMRGRWQSMPPGRRAELRQKLRDRFNSMPPEQRARLKGRLKQMHEQRQQLREKLQERGEQRQERREQNQERREEGREQFKERREDRREQIRERQGDRRDEREQRRRGRRGPGDGERRGHPGGRR